MNNFLKYLTYSIRPLSVIGTVVFILYIIMVANEAKNNQENKDKEKNKDN